MQIYQDDQLLSLEFRQQIINEINAEENVARKKESQRRYDLMKDQNKKYVVERLQKELAPETVEEMIHRASNLSVFRAIVEKKAQVYKDGIVREVDDENYQQSLDLIVKYLDLNSQMKRVNKTLEAHKNAAVQIVPYENEYGEYSIKFNVLQPHMYDVINDLENPEIARAVVFSYFADANILKAQLDSNLGGLRSQSPVSTDPVTDGKNNLIADVNDGQTQFFVWWSGKYHFTTNSVGEIVSGPEIENNIGVLPYVFFAYDQDGQFWAKGGDDLADGSILVNVMLTDLYFIAKTQGMGLFYLFGKNIPKSVKVGPNQAVVMEVNEGEPTPQIGFASSTPPLAAHLDLVRNYVATLLKNNDLEPGDVMGDITSSSASSGVQELIQKAELAKNIESKRQLFIDKEPMILKIIFKWLNFLYTNSSLETKWKELGTIPEDVPMNIKFPPVSVYQTEKEQLDIMKQRRELGIDSVIDSIRRDNPDMTIEEAYEKANRVVQDKMIEMKLRAVVMAPTMPNMAEKEPSPNEVEDTKDDLVEDTQEGEIDQEDGS